jgi:hypothetical protein
MFYKRTFQKCCFYCRLYKLFYLFVHLFSFIYSVFFFLEFSLRNLSQIIKVICEFYSKRMTIDCKIIVFEVKNESFFIYLVNQGQQTLIKVLHYTKLWFLILTPKGRRVFWLKITSK